MDGSGDISPVVKRDGSFDTHVPALAGSYHVHWWDSTRAGCFVKSVTVGGKDVTDSGFTIGGGNVALEVVLSANSATLEGSVVDIKSDPASDVQVFCIPDSKRRLRFDLYRKVTTDEYGHFHLRGITPGKYEVLAVDTDWDEDDLRDTELPPDWKGETIDLKEGENKKIKLNLAASHE